MLWKSRLIAVFYTCVLSTYTHETVRAEDLSLHADIRQISYFSWKDPRFSTQNPNNDFLGLYRYQAHAELRPDIYLTSSRYKFMLKPRYFYEYNWGRYGDATLDSGDSRDDFYINEALFQVKLAPEFFASYGRENLQWGPSYLRTPSNPFFRENGRDNPKKEVEGKDFLRAIYLPNEWLTISVIGNFEQGELRADTQQNSAEAFKPRHALKFDVIGNNYSTSLILSRREGGNTSLGGYLQSTVSDALLVYFDATLNRGNAILYPQLDPTNPLGGNFERRYDNSSEQRFIGITGISYTMENSATLSFEYMYNGAGYDDTEARDYYYLRQNAADNIKNPTLGSLARNNLASTLTPGSILLRQHYLFGQYLFNEMGSDLSYTLRWTGNMDDHSTQTTAIVEYAYNDNIQIFTIASAYNGKNNSEFSSILKNEIMFGFEYTF